MAYYDKGDLVRVSGAFTDIDGVAQDPATITFKFKDPADNVTTYTYGVDAELVKDSVGNYHVDVDADEVGVWYYRYAATGNGQCAEEGDFTIRGTEF